MPKLDSIEGFGIGDSVKVVRRHPVIGIPPEPGKVAWFYEGDDGSGKWVYLYFEGKYGVVSTHGPFGFRPTDLEVI